MKSASLVSFAFLITSAVTFAAAIPVTWTTVNLGTLGPVNVALGGVNSQFLMLESRSYTSPDFSAAPIPATQAVEYGANNNWTVTFSAPISNLLLYVDQWRGAYNSPGPDPDTHYTFSMPFTIESGLAGSSVSANTVTLPFDLNNPFYSGIMKFSGPVTSLSVRSDGLNDSGQDLTFAIVTTVPEPASISLVVIGAAALFALGKRRRTPDAA